MTVILAVKTALQSLVYTGRLKVRADRMFTVDQSHSSLPGKVSYIYDPDDVFSRLRILIAYPEHFVRVQHHFRILRKRNLSLILLLAATFYMT